MEHENEYASKDVAGTGLGFGIALRTGAGGEDRADRNGGKAERR